jgi:PKD repeat protein
MSLIYARTRLLAATVGAALALSACTVHSTNVPALNGPSGLGISIDVAASPDILSWDGASQARVVITARDSNGQANSGLNLLVDVPIGTLSQRSVTTDNTGQAVVIYTAPVPPATPQGAQMVNIQVTPLPNPSSGGGNSANSTPRVASITLVPPGVVVGPPSTLVASFAVPTLNVGDTGAFSAKVVDSKGNDATNQVVSFQWSFGDATTATGQNVTHVFKSIGTFQVTLTITDASGHTNSVTQSITIGQGQLPTPVFTFSPQPAVINQSITFNATASTAAPGHKIAEYDWDFGDGTSGTGQVATHTYTSPNASFVVTLKVIDDANRQATVSQTILVGSDLPTPKITITPSNPTAAAGTTAAVVFDGSTSTAAPGHVIKSYAWQDSLGRIQFGPSVSGSFLAGQSYTIQLTVTDDAGNTNSVTLVFTVTAT